MNVYLWKSHERYSKGKQCETTDDEATPPRPDPAGMGGRQVHLVAEHVHVELQQQRPQGVAHYWAQRTSSIRER